jgi:hypothetical protein
MSLNRFKVFTHCSSPNASYWSISGISSPANWNWRATPSLIGCWKSSPKWVTSHAHTRVNVGERRRRLGWTRRLLTSKRIVLVTITEKKKL